MKRVSYNEFIKRFELRANKEYQYIKGYTKMSNKIKVKHLKCGHEFDVVATVFINTKTGCKMCANKNIGIKNHEKRTKVDDKEKIDKLTNGQYTLLSEYKGYKKNILLKHNECGHIYEVKYSNFMKGNRCPKCNRNKQRTKEELIKDFNLTDIDILRIDYPKVEIQCKICSEIKTINIQTLKSKNKHMCCKKKIKEMKSKLLKLKNITNKSINELECINQKNIKLEAKYNKYKEEVQKEHGDSIIILNKVYTTESKFEVKCTECNHVWKTNFKRLKQGKGCPICKMSKGERKIYNFLNEKDYIFEREYTITELEKLKFDFAIFLDNTIKLIEFDGEQHYNIEKQFGDSDKEQKFNKQKNNDDKKDKYCKDNNIELLRIPYFEYDNIEILLQEFLK